MTTVTEPNSNKNGSIFSNYSEKVMRDGKIIDEWEQPEDMFLRIIREYDRIEKEVFAHAT